MGILFMFGSFVYFYQMVAEDVKRHVVPVKSSLQQQQVLDASLTPGAKYRVWIESLGVERNTSISSQSQELQVPKEGRFELELEVSGSNPGCFKPV